MNRKHFILLTTAVFLLTAMFPTLLSATDWPRWRGPNGDGISMEKDWNPKALANPKLVWRSAVGMGHSSLSVQGNYLYTMGNTKTGSGDGAVYFDTVYCLDTRSGKEVWKYSYPCGNTQYPGPRTTPTVDGKYVYTLSWEGHLFCFNAKNGRVVWKRHLVNDGLSARPNWGFSGSPIAEGDMLILTANKSGIALNKRTGKVIWKSESGACDLPSPLLFTSNGKRLAAIPQGRNLNAVDVKTGKIVWTHARERVDIDPVISGDRMLLYAYRNSRVLDISGDKPKELLKTSNVRFNGFLNAVILNGHVYGFHSERSKEYLACMDLKTGDVKWKENVGRFGGLMAADGKLIVLKGDGTLEIAKASEKGYNVISSARVLKMSSNEGLQMPQQCHCWTIPVLANGKIFARNNYGELVCVDVKI